MKQPCVKTHAEPKVRKSEYKGLTSKHWQVYYYLVSISKYNSEAVENHRFLYESELNYSGMAKKLGMSRPTVYKAMDKLKEVKLIKKNGKKLLIEWGKDYTKINLNLLTTMIDWSLESNRKNGTIDLLRIYLSLKLMDELAVTSEQRSFTKRELIQILGHSDKDAELYKDVQYYLALLSYNGLIELKMHKEYQEKYGSYTVYHLQKVYDKDSVPDLTMDIKAEVGADKVLSEEMKEKLMFAQHQLMTN